MNEEERQIYEALAIELAQQAILFMQIECGDFLGPDGVVLKSSFAKLRQSLAANGHTVLVADRVTKAPKGVTIERIIYGERWPQSMNSATTE